MPPFSLNATLEALKERDLDSLRAQLDCLSVPLRSKLRFDRDGTTLLLAAIKTGNLDAVNLILSYETRTDVNDYRGKSAVYAAVEVGSEAILETLLKHGADSKTATHRGITPIGLAALKDREGCLKALLRYGHSIEETISDHSKRTLIALSSQAGSITVLKYLLSENADVNVTDYVGRTPLHLATLARQLTAVKLLLNANANIETVSKASLSPLSCALLLPFPYPYLRAFILAGATIPLSVIEIARANNRDDLVLFLAGMANESKERRLLALREDALILAALRGSMIDASAKMIAAWYEKDLYLGQPPKTKRGEALMRLIQEPLSKRNVFLFPERTRQGAETLALAVHRLRMPIELLSMIFRFIYF